jgi:hypothetical protein
MKATAMARVVRARGVKVVAVLAALPSLITVVAVLAVPPFSTRMTPWREHTEDTRRDTRRRTEESWCDRYAR